jgi:hypothetical protein
VIVATTTCSGANHSGKCPAWLSIRMPRKRSSDPTDRPVDHHRLLLLRILVDVEGAEAFRQVEVDLRRAALPVAADGIFQRVFELRPVEGALALIDAGLDASAGFGGHLARAPS